MEEIGLKGPSGLGDSIYMYPIIKWFLNSYDTVHTMCNYPELFESLPNVKCHRHLKLNHVMDEGRKVNIAFRFSYGPYKHHHGSTQFQDMLTFGRNQFPELPNLPLEMPWEIRNQDLVAEIKGKARGRKIAIVAAPYQPFGRTDKFGEEIKIDNQTFQFVVDDLKDEYYRVSVGNEFCLYEPMLEYNLIGQTSVPDMLDLCKISDLMVSQVGNFIPIAEVFKKKNIILFSKVIKEFHDLYFKSKHSDKKYRFMGTMTPEKVIHKKELNLSMYDDEYSSEKVHEFC